MSEAGSDGNPLSVADSDGGSGDRTRKTASTPIRAQGRQKFQSKRGSPHQTHLIPKPIDTTVPVPVGV